MVRSVFVHRMLRWLRERFMRRTISKNITDELSFHLAQRIAEYEHAGLPPREARRKALERFGSMDVVIDTCHEVQHVPQRKDDLMAGIWQDLRVAVRTIRHAPGFAGVAILTLALGIGANTAVFTVLNSVLLSPLPYHQPEQLVRLVTGWDQFPDSRGVLSGPDFVDHRAGVDAFQHLAVLYTYRERGLDINTGGVPQRIRALPVSSGYFEVYRAVPLLGRTLTLDEERESARVAVLSHHLWQEIAGGDREVVGSGITMDGVSYTVIGVMPPSFLDVVAGEIDVWIPQDLQPDYMFNGRHNTYLTGIGRLKAGVSLEQAQAQLDVISANLQEQYPESNERRSLKIYPMFEEVVGSSKTMLFVLMGAAGLVLLIACVNVANLFLARSVARQRELAVRSALGAGAMRLARQLLTEGLVLAAAGGAVGLAVTFVGVRFLLAISPQSLARASEVSFDVVLLGFTLVLTIVTGLMFGLVPALWSARLNLNDTLRDSTRGTTGGVRGRHMRGALVSSQMALALVLLVGAGLLMKSFVTLLRTDLGIDAENVTTFEVHLPDARYGEPEQRIRFHLTFQDRLRALPGVEAVGATSWLPVSGRYHSWGFRWENAAGETEGISAQNRVVEGDYFEAIGISLLQGRTFTRSDDMDAPAVTIISKSAADRAFPDGDAIGRQVGAVGEVRTVVGVVSDVAVDHRGGFQPTTYAPHTEFGDDRNWALIQVVRTRGEASGLLNAVRNQLAAIDQDLVVYHPRTMDVIMGRQVARDRFALTLMGIFAAVALTLAAIGIYGVLSYSVSQRTQEIGIRMALGARAVEVRRIVVGQGLTLAVLGIVVGVGGAFALSRLLDSMVFGVSVRDPLIFTTVPITLGAVAALAGYLPARRATRVDPMEALRSE
jgi:putative ABC transport system permease protein